MPKTRWRPMTSADLPAMLAVAAIVHPDYPEDEAVFAERLRLFPEGCWVLGGRDGLHGYVVSHPWLRAAPPALDSLLGAVPAQATCLYIHDLALLRAARGSGAGGAIVARLAKIAARSGLPRLALVAIDGSPGFWQRQGFRVLHEPALAATLASYDDAARYMEREVETGAMSVAETDCTETDGTETDCTKTD